MNAATESVSGRIESRLWQFHLTTAAREMPLRLSQAGLDEALPVVDEVLTLEAEARRERRIVRLRKAAELPPAKTMGTFNLGRLPAPLADRIRELARGEFLERAVNVLAFGLPGVGKSHAACALGHALLEQGHSVLFRPAYQLVQELLAAKREVKLPRLLRKLDGFELLIVDDIGYVKQSPEEAEVLFTLIAERYESRSLLITSNLVFSDWERIFKEPMATAAAIDRVVHHSVILEFGVPSFRGDEAAQAQATSKTATSKKPKGGDPTSHNHSSPPSGSPQDGGTLHKRRTRETRLR